MRQAAILSGLALLAACGSAAAAGREQRTAPTGTWGGDHVLLEVTAGGAALELDCAHGTVEGPIRLDGEGRFDVGGTFVQERGGPVREGQENARPARYAGRVEGQTMTLTIAVGDGGDTLGPFELVRGRGPRLTKCL
ncbi:MAG TPA: hypothetical protein VGC93_15015 [Thermoanaerobaculia bacterium]